MSANRWRRALAAGGKQALASKGASGARCKLTPGQLAELEAVLEAGPAAWGWTDSSRTYSGGLVSCDRAKTGRLSTEFSSNARSNSQGTGCVPGRYGY
jgi:hypothetical protein